MTVHMMEDKLLEGEDSDLILNLTQGNFENDLFDQENEAAVASIVRKYLH